MALSVTLQTSSKAAAALVTAVNYVKAVSSVAFDIAVGSVRVVCLSRARISSH